MRLVGAKQLNSNIIRHYNIHRLKLKVFHFEECDLQIFFFFHNITILNTFYITNVYNIDTHYYM